MPHPRNGRGFPVFCRLCPDRGPSESPCFRPPLQAYKDMFICLVRRMDRLVAMLRAAGDPTRLRLLLLLRAGGTDGERADRNCRARASRGSPAISSCLGEAGLLERFKEGSWVFYRAADRGKGAELGAALASSGRSQPGPGRRRPAGACAPDPRRRCGRLFQGQCAGMGAHPRPACAGKGCRSRHRQAA